ncbi:3'-5' exonuclease [Alteromonas gracilis]|uniref:3'-5' exonuclease n=1 Tax=Alteromonas gracilis TaxID=1479524 RepID=UPI0036F23D0D
MNNIMLYLETMGTGSNAAIVSIGAVFFNPLTSELGEEFYERIWLESAAKYGELDASTVAWWLGQSDEARAEINHNDSVGLSEAMRGFSEFVINNTKGSFTDTRVWGNGCTFDNVIIANAYKQLKLQKPWSYAGDMDVRTIVELGRKLLNFDPKKDMPFEGEKHNALADAIHQAKYVSAIYQKLAEATHRDEVEAA